MTTHNSCFFFVYEFMCILVSLFDTFDIGYCINSHFSDFVFFFIKHVNSLFLLLDIRSKLNDYYNKQELLYRTVIDGLSIKLLNVH